MRRGGRLSYDEASSVASNAFTVIGVSGESPALPAPSNDLSAPSPPTDQLLLALPRESLAPVALAYIKCAELFWSFGPFYHTFMSFFEIPINLARALTIPLLNTGGYRRKLVVLCPPFALAFFVAILTTKIIPLDSAFISGTKLPVVIVAMMIGCIFSVLLHFLLPPGAPKVAGLGERTSLLDSATKSVASASPSTHHDNNGIIAYCDNLIDILFGPAGADEPPSGFLFGALLCVSFIQSLFWLLLIANELVGTVLAFGKVLAVPEIVMGLGVLAVGNSINDFAASVTIAREGFAQMAIAGAYAGPMFNVIAGIGMPMILKASTNPDLLNPSRAYIGGGTPLEAPIVWMGYSILISSLVIVTIWVPLESFRMTHRIGFFLSSWFCLFLILLIIMALTVGGD